MLTIAVLAIAALGQTDPFPPASGWTLYSGPNASTLWHGYRQKAFPAKGWTVAGGELRVAKGGGGGDILTNAMFGDFEAAFEFKLGEKSNSGIIWRVTEKHDASWQTGPEYQLLEDATYGVSSTDGHSCGALYDLAPPATGKVMKPVGEWNEGRIYLRNGLLQHWLNGVKVVEMTIADANGTPTKAWLDAIAGSKFKAYEGFGLQPRGGIAVQDHGDTDLALRNFFLRDLGTARTGEVALFNGHDLTGWKAVVPEAAAKGLAPESVWSVRDGVLVCAGNPVGYIRTTATYTNFILRLQWRFDPAKGAGNSGVLLRMMGEDKVWPKSVEAQLHSGNAGDFWNIDEFPMTTDPSRTKGRNTKKTHGAERPLGEWNEYEIIVNKGDVILKVNGEELNRATGVAEVPGHLCLQSEGAEIHFRDIRLVPLP
ncbi:MAG: hypothetical protein HBSAPP03_03890 [Phycisphaerae bacterium]|nr:MAG: hypothetical protein HBSAPP03_03890 [Phycisphaerae bacterium]